MNSILCNVPGRMEFVRDMLVGLALKCLGSHGNYIERNVNSIRKGSGAERLEDFPIFLTNGVSLPEQSSRISLIRDTETV
jgi:hypothetical protein